MIFCLIKLNNVIDIMLEKTQEDLDVALKSWDSCQFEYSCGRKHALEEIKKEIKKIIDFDNIDCYY